MPPKKRSPLVVVPAAPKTRVTGAAAVAKKAPGNKRPVDPREHPAARDSRGTASRTEIRKETPRRTAPRQAPARRTGASRRSA